MNSIFIGVCIRSQVVGSICLRRLTFTRRSARGVVPPRPGTLFCRRSTLARRSICILGRRLKVIDLSSPLIGLFYTGLGNFLSIAGFLPLVDFRAVFLLVATAKSPGY